MGRGWCHAAARHGGRWASAVVGQRGVAGSSPAAALTGGARARGTRLAVKQGRAGGDQWAPATVPGGGGLNTIQIQMNSNYFKTFQTLTDSKTTFPSLKNLK
jgi:hypothetical protein